MVKIREVGKLLGLLNIHWPLFIFVYSIVFFLAIWGHYETKLTMILYERHDSEFANHILFIIFFMTFTSVLKQVFYGYLRSKTFVQFTIAFFKKICNETTDIWDIHYQKTELTKIILNDLRVFISTVTDILQMFLQSITNTVLISYFLINTNPKYFFFSLAMCGCRSLILERLAVYWEKKMDAVQETKLETEKYMVEYINHHTQMQIYGLQNVYISLIDQLFKEYAIRKNEEIRLYFIFILTFFTISKLTDIGIYFIVDTIHNNLATMPLIVMYMKTMSESIQSFVDINKSLLRNKDSIERVLKYNSVSGVSVSGVSVSERADSGTNIPNVHIEFKDVCFKYPTRDECVLERVNKTIKSGKQGKYVLSGKSGKGKSTIVKLLLGLYTVNSGEITINGRNITCYSKEELYRTFSVIPQEPMILEDKTLKDNITLFVHRELNDDIIKDTLCKVKLDTLACHLDEKLVSLSGGQKQRLAVARALLNNTPVIILDEAFSAMDIPLKRELYTLVKKECGDKLVIMITHDRDLLFKNAKIWKL